MPCRRSLTQEYFKPIVTPYELYLALTAPADGSPLWGSDWISDFDNVMSLNTKDDTSVEEENDLPHFSLITGKLVYSETSRPMRSQPQTEIEYDTGDALVKSESQVAVRKDGTVAVRGVPSLAGKKLLERSWRGLDPGVGEDGGAEVQIGRDGIARGYKASDDTLR